EQAVLIIGAGPGGSALLDIFSKEAQIRIAGIVDTNPDAPAIKLAHKLNIQVYTDVEAALEKSGDCIVFNMTRDQSLAEVAVRHVGAGRVIGGQEAKFFWHIITRLQAVKIELLDNQTRLQAVIHNVQEGIILIDPDGIIENANPATSRIFGYTLDELIGHHIEMLMPKTGETKYEPCTWEEMINGENSVVGHCREVVAIHSDGRQFPLEINVAGMELEGLKHFVGIVRDITERKIAEGKLTQMALYDHLTGLPNRTNFFDRLEFSLSHARRNQSVLALLFIDLDGFKKINDTLGHAMGDRLLKEVAQRLRANTRGSDTVARMGGDEFTVILNNLQDIEDATCIAEKLIKAMNQPIDLDGNTYNIGASIGIAAYPDHAGNMDELINAADSAMYQAKANGKNKYEISKT
ncbi:MAG: diguanylate cyclase, partial [Gallionella sp.]